jgi:23S rRNA (cytosine1962-C5)-methyltransferase
MGMLADRILKNARHLRKWGRRQGFTCLRLYDHDIPQYPLSLDDYEGHLLVTLSQGCQAGEEELQSEAACLDPVEVVFKQRGSATESRLNPEKAFVIHEGDLRFEINLHGYQDSGLFLDHRLTRRRIGQHASGRRLLNLFCYTASFSVAAAAGGADSVTSVDLSATYLEWGRRNFLCNRLRPDDHRWIQADILQWLPQAIEAGERYDCIVCDPPTFSNSKRMRQTFEVQRCHGPLMEDLLKLLAPGGELFFSCNDRGFRLDPRLPLREITSQTRSEDFRRGSGHRCWYYTKDS